MRALFFLFLPFAAIAAPNIPLQEGIEPPLKLSETGLFNRLSPLEPSPELRPYEINQALWVDHAQKQRFLYLPAGSKVGFSPTEAYGFPVGAIFVKHFRMETSKNVFRNIETRILIHKDNAGKWEGYTYVWEGDDARLVEKTEKVVVSLEVDETAPGGARAQKFKIPTRVQCMQCHNASVGFVRSFLTPQLNRASGIGNQLEQLAHDGIFDLEIGAASQYEAYARIDDLAQSLDKRVKSYFAVNCSHCHNPAPEAMCNFTGLDFRFGMIKVEDLVASGHLKPGKKEESEIFRRMSSTMPGERMPYFGSDLRDETALGVIGEWIDGLAAKLR
jgi:hypothetical protein